VSSIIERSLIRSLSITPRLFFLRFSSLVTAFELLIKTLDKLSILSFNIFLYLYKYQYFLYVYIIYYYYIHFYIFDTYFFILLCILLFFYILLFIYIFIYFYMCVAFNVMILKNRIFSNRIFIIYILYFIFEKILCRLFRKTIILSLSLSLSGGHCII